MTEVEVTVEEQNIVMKYNKRFEELVNQPLIDKRTGMHIHELKNLLQYEYCPYMDQLFKKYNIDQHTNDFLIKERKFVKKEVFD